MKLYITYVFLHNYDLPTQFTYVTGLSKTDQIVTLGLFHFIGPGNGYTCKLHIYSTITRLS